MISTSTILRFLAVAPAAVIANVIRADKDFDYSAVSYREVGARNTLDWRVWLEYSGNPISFWHDIPLYPNEDDKTIVNFYTEIPRWTDGKIETKRDEPLNPIFHDDKKKQPRFVYSVWPHRSYPFNYGSVPQTWESPNHVHDLTGLPGDNDPVDIIDISSVKPASTGEIRQVKIIGGLPMIDDGSTDWKAVGIYVKDPLANVVNSIEDLDKYRPGLRQAFYDWFIYYKVVKGDGTNTIANSTYVNAATMQSVLEQSHGYWEDLVKGKGDHVKNEISINQTSHPTYCQSYIRSEDATKAFKIPKKSNIKPAEKRPEEFDLWYYLDKDFKLIELPGQ